MADLKSYVSYGICDQPFMLASTQWVTKVMTPASMYLLWKQGHDFCGPLYVLRRLTKLNCTGEVKLDECASPRNGSAGWARSLRAPDFLLLRSKRHQVWWLG